MDATENERMSVLLSTFLEHSGYIGTPEEVDIFKKNVVLKEQLSRFHGEYHIVICGSRGEGLDLKGSDMDQMVIFSQVLVMYPDQCIPANMAHKTILYMRKADCSPGYVKLQLGRLGQRCHRLLCNALIRIGDSTFVSSDVFREQCVSHISTHTCLKHESNGPSCTLFSSPCDGDFVCSFPCNNWPTEAGEWITRPRLYGWPSQTMISKVVDSGCHLVPVGDKCSDDTLLQWRISFATTERSLVHSFSHIQLKVYTLLKYFLKQIKSTLKQTIGDDDIVCSYFLKTTIFHAIENSSQLFWQDKNLFYCFWFCFNILIAWVRAGFCPNYFIPANNMFRRKVHGQHQKTLLDILNNYCQMKWMCLSVGNFFNPTIWDELSNISIQAQLLSPKPLQEIVLHQDAIIAIAMSEIFVSTLITPRRTIRQVLQLLSTSQSGFDAVYTYHYAMQCLRSLAAAQVYPDHTVATDNKTRYRSLRKCKHWISSGASMGTELLYLATFYFLTGNFSKPIEMCLQVIKLASGFSDNFQEMVEVLNRSREYLQLGDIAKRLRKIYTNVIVFSDKELYPPHLCLELFNECIFIVIPPLPYALFLFFLCCHELGDTRGRDAALHHLIEVQYDDDQGGQRFWIVHTLLGICYQTLGDYHRAIGAFWESAQSKGYYHDRNPAFKRIAIVYLCMYSSQGPAKGYQ